MYKHFLKLSFFLFTFFCSSLLNAQVAVTATLGTPFATYTTLKGGFDAINAGTHQGVITISLTDSTTETASAILNASGSGSALYNSVSISPTVPVLITGNFVGAIIKLNGADHVTIDGRIAGSGRNITIQNTSTTAATAAVWLSSTGAGAGAKLNTIRNCEMLCGVSQNTGATLTYGVIMTGATIATTSAGADNDSNQILENRIIRVRYGILTRGEIATNLNEGTLINGNIIGPTSSGADQIGKTGILTQFENNCTISYNTVQFVGGAFANTSAGADRIGIGLSSDAWTPTVAVSTNYSVHHNTIHDVIDERLFSAVGILHAAGNGGLPTNHMIYNNFIYNVRANGTGSDQGIGIGISAGANDRIVYNSISMTGGDIDPPSAGNATQSNCGIRIFSATPIDLTLKNNIINVDLSSNTATLNHYCIVAPSGTYSWGTGGLNNNDYYINAANPQMKIGGTGTTVPYTPFTTFLAWKTNFSATQDLNSQNIAPNFISATNLHIITGVISNLESKGTAIPGVNNDIDNDVRPGPAGSLNGGALAPDIGADEFDGIPSLIDLGISALVSPFTSGCHTSSETIRVRLFNYSIQAINFATDSVTITANVSGVNPMVFPSLVINSGTLASMSYVDTILAIGYNMSALGNYTFNSAATVIGDGNNTNNAMPPVAINISAGTATASDSVTCELNPVTFTASGYTNGGNVQWQYYSVATLSWTNFPGGNVNPFTVQLSDSTYHYRALICNTYPTADDSVDVIIVAPPIANDVTRCGPGTVQLQAPLPAGATGIGWYNAPVGGTLLDTGTTFTTPFLLNTQNFYVAATSGSAPVSYSVGYINTANYSFLTQTAGWGSMFTVNTDCFFDSVGVYPTGTGTISIKILDPSNNVLYTSPTVPLSGTGTQKIMIPVGAALAPGNYKLGQSTTGVTNLGSQPTGGSFAYPFVSPPLTITSGSQGGGPVAAVYYWFYDWRISVASGCEGPRDTVTVTVTPSDTIIATAVTDPICSNVSTVINVNSINSNYQYTWSPAAGLSGTTGPSVTTTSDTTITYTIHAIDNGTTCAEFTNIQVTVLQAPTISISTPDTALCANTTLPFDGISGSHIIFNGTVGAGTSSNTAASTTILGPYGAVYGGARHQYLIFGTDLQAAGLTAGPIDYISFEVTALNSVQPLADYTIKAGPTSLAVLTTSYITGLPTLYYNPSYMPTLGWNSHDIAPIVWDGVSNIVVEVCFNNMNAGSTNGNASVRYTPTTGTNTVNYYRADNDPNVCGMLSGTPGINRPNIRFSRTAPLTYQWTPATGLSNTTIIDPMLTATSTNTYTLQVTDDVNGCIETDMVNITVNPLPVFTIGNDTVICSNTSPTPFAIYGSNINLDYVWFDNTVASGTLVYDVGTYYATGTDANGCSSSDTMVVGTVDPVNVDINVNVTGTNIADLDAGSGFSSYLWSNSQNTQITTVTGNGIYWVHVTDGNGCPSADTVSLIFSLGIPNVDGTTGQVLFYPNPSNGIFNIAGTGLTGDPMKIEIMDINGKMVYIQNIEAPTENFIEQINLNYVEEGSYLVRVSTLHQIYTSKIIITLPNK